MDDQDSPESTAKSHPEGTALERALFGNGSIEGTLRMVIYAAAFVLLFGTLFYLLPG